MQENSQDIIKFTEAFFNNLKSELSWNGKVLQVTKVPSDFEEFFGKKAPYILAFEPGIDSNAELMSKGSFLLKAMTNYLESRGQTTLIKINFTRNYKEEFEKYLKLKNCELYSLTSKVNNKIILRFTFATVLQYLNEKEQLINTVYVEDGKIINFNPDKYSTLEGRTEDIQKKDIKEDYTVAKEELKKILQTKVQETSINLKKRLDKEIERIKEHYKHQYNEVEIVIKRYQDQIVTLEKQLAKTEIKDPLTIAKIDKLKESIKSLSDSEKKQIWEKEEKFFINDETHKHTLNINNKIINTTIIYYPIFDFTVFLKSKESARQFNLTYNPMLDTLTEIQCDVCKRPTVEISICSSGHINCQNCIDKCRSCYSSLCSNCLKKECDACGIKLCKKCSVKCNKCFKFFCKNHLRQDYVSGKDYCTNCIKRCMSCNQFTTAINMKPGTEICKKCATLSVLKGKL